MDRNEAADSSCETAPTPNGAELLLRDAEDDPAKRSLRSGAAPWRRERLDLARALAGRSATCDVLVVGSGITGSLVAEALSREGHSVVVVDRFSAGAGSTAASTAMLLWRLDTSLLDLSERLGFETARSIYGRSLAAMSGLDRLVLDRAISCSYAPRPSLYLGGPGADDRELRREFELGERAGLPGSWLGRDRLEEHFGIDRSAAILSPGSAELDPVLLSNGLLRLALANGATLIEDVVVSYDWDARAAWVGLSGGGEIEAGHIVLATGYDMPDFVQSELHRVVSTWCLTARPTSEHPGWVNRALVWEDAEPYIYARGVTDGRIIAGGEDQVTSDAREREGLTAPKIARLAAKMQQLSPHARYTIDEVWSAEFGETEDGLPLIGRVAGAPRCLAAYGYGGNGITYSYMASRMIPAIIAGREKPWFADFALDRSKG